MIKFFKSEQEIIQEIHDSFDNAQDQLIHRALQIINSVDVSDMDKAERLSKIGFINSKAVTESQKKKSILQMSKQEAELVEYYKRTYPFLKFLKEEQLEEICEKYNLIFAPVSRYKEDVPDKNLYEIETAQPLRNEDTPENKCFLSVSGFWSSIPSNLKQILKKGFYIDNNKSKIDESDVIGYARKFGGYNGNYDGYVTSIFGTISVTEEKRNGELFIAAPKSHFDLKGLKNNEKGFFNFSVTEVKDPVVFRYCRGGIQVLSKWGLEAKDELLQNETLN